MWLVLLLLDADLAVDLAPTWTAVDFAFVVVFIGFDWFAAMAVPVIRKAAAVIDASSFFKMRSSFP